MIDRRQVLAMGGALAASPAIARAAAIDASVRTGTLKDVEHVVILMQENRGFDHYFGTMSGVRGFADRFPIPLPGGQTVWTQTTADGRKIAPFPLDTTKTFDLMRIEGTPHNWSDAQAAWDHGRMSRWPQAKTDRTMAHYRAEDLPFQFALADAFTVCDAYHCSIQTGTNTNRLFLFTGTHDPLARGGGPALTNSHDSMKPSEENKAPYLWTTYAERLQTAGVSWRVYQDMADNFSDNPLVGFKAFRDSHAGAAGSDPALARLGMTTHDLIGLRGDIAAGTLPQVSYIVSTAAQSEHPGPSSPAQGADFTAQVIAALTTNAEVWSRTVLLVMFDENDGFFDHVPPPAPPSRIGEALAGASTVDTTGEYHLHSAASEAKAERPDLMGRPYGLGARVPMYVVSPWSRGGYVNSQVFDHTSVIRFLEQRFGVMEPNISPWRRSICGDLTSAFDFKTPNNRRLSHALPPTRALADRAKALAKKTVPPTPATPAAPVQAAGPRPSRALPYALDVTALCSAKGVDIGFINRGAAGAVLHVYDRLNLGAIPRRYTLGAGQSLAGHWPSAPYDLWILGPNGFHRHIRGPGAADGDPMVMLDVDHSRSRATLRVSSPGKARRFKVSPTGMNSSLTGWTPTTGAGRDAQRPFSLSATRGWYDLTVTCEDEPTFLRRLAGRIETGKDSISDPAMSGPAIMRWS